MIREYVKGKDEKLSEHFSSSEFDCKCMRDDCNVTYIDSSLISFLEAKRALWRKPIKIHSGFRCTHHNQRVGGKPGSRHLIGMAADISVDGMTMNKIASDCRDAGGLGIYKTFVHVDMRLGKSRWTG